MIRTIKLFLTGFILCVSFTACEKEYSVENGGTPGSGGTGGTSSGTAVFTLTGAPGACVTPIVSGIYQQGTALDATNTVVVTVNVTTLGTYTISTATINGITFSASGTFVITGTQIVTLTGNGTPTAAGTFTYIPGTNGCAFPLTVTGTGSGPAVGTLDCATAALAGVYTQGIILTSTNTVSIPVNVTTAGSYSITTVATNGCTFSGSGNLALGAQTIVLTGSGLPVNSGATSFPISLGASNCSFSITFLPGTPPATGTLDCSTATLAGVYTQGTALNSTNTVTIPVNVTVAGPYLITTTTNGCTFSGSGSLALGAQNIVLTGSGTPVNSGAISFPVSLGTSSCNFSITFIAGDFLKCSVDGGPITNFNTALSGSLVAGSFTVDGQSATQALQVGVVDANGGTIATGTYHNASPTNTTLYCGDQLTNIGSSTPIWSDVSVTSNIFTVNITSITATTVTGTFSGTLTDVAGTGGSKVITNGSFSITY